MMGRCWVGGATGFLGSHLCRQLLEDGHGVVGVSRSGGSPLRGASQSERFEARAVDVLDERDVAASAAGCEVAFLATGKVDRGKNGAKELHRVHVFGTRHALRGLKAAGVRRVVLASSSGTLAVGTDPERVYDESAKPPLELILRWPYYRTKYYAELEALEQNDPGRFDVVIVNPSLLLGPGDTRESSTRDVRLFLERSIVAVPAGGLSFVDARDAARGMRLAAESGVAGERYLLNAKNLSIAAFFARLSRLSGVPAPSLKLPASPQLAMGLNSLFSRAVRKIGGEPPVDEESVELGQYYWYCDAARAEREFGFQARDPGETLRDMLADMVERGVVPSERVFNYERN
jgi:dihydroflavonol-4-reductase